jgi:dextranase
MKIKDIFPSRAQYNKNSKIEIIIELEDLESFEDEAVILKLYNLENKLCEQKTFIESGQTKVISEFVIDNNNLMTGYGVEAELWLKDNIIDSLSTSFDIVDKWEYVPRYGFLSDFFEKDKDDENDILEMSKFHINVVQFYDWMYRHHELLPPQNNFIDILGRELSLEVVKQKLDYAHKYDMKTMAYGAVYGAEKEFFNKHKDWGLIKNNGEVFGFIDFIYIMDISRECGWHDHIISEFEQAIKFGFDGIHMDQYGFPKEAISNVNGISAIRYLREDYKNLINDTKEQLEKNGYASNLIFNAVNNWPIDAVANANQNAMYIEVWPPNDTYQALYNLITNAKRYESSKQVILAAYMKPFSKNVEVNIKHAENATLMTMATIFASGGFHLLLGENLAILSEPYYPDHRLIESKSFKRELRNYYDFIVRYEELLYSYDIVDYTSAYTGGINGEYVFKGADFSVKAETGKVLTLIKENKNFKIIHLVNYTGIDSMNWNDGKPNRPQVIENVEITALVTEKFKGIYVVSPDSNNNKPLKLDYKYVKHDNGKAVRFKVPILKLWDLIYISILKE